MTLSEFEIGKIAEIVAGKVGTTMDAKELRRVIDQVVDKMTTTDQQTPNRVESATCEVASSEPSQASVPGEPQNVVEQQGGLYERLDQTTGTRVILAAFGHNRPGVISALTQVLAENQCNLEDISQKIMREFFTLIMIVDITNSTIEFSELVEKVKATETRFGMKVYMMHEDTFQYMHRI